MRVLAVDYGKARIGLAISDPTKTIASPLPTIKSSGDPQRAAQILIDAIQELKTYTISHIVIGLPLNLNGRDSDTTALVRKFVEEVQKLTSIPVSDRALREFQMTRKERSKKVDAATATILLQNYLELSTPSYPQP